MPKKNWFKNLWNWRKNKNKEKNTMRRTSRMPSFKIKKVQGIKIKALDSQGRDITRFVKHSYVFDGNPGGFYLDTKEMTEQLYY